MTPAASGSAARSIVLTSKSGQFGGMEFRMLDEARFLVAQGHKVTVAAPHFPGVAGFVAALAEIEVPSRQFEPPPFLTNWRLRHLHWLRSRAAGRRALAGLQPDLAHVFMSWSDQGLEQLWSARQAGAPTVISVHNAFPACDFTPWHRRHIAHAFAGLRGLYAVSRSALAQFEAIFEAWIPKDAIRTVIYNAVDSERFRPRPDCLAIRAELGLDATLPLIGSFGRFDDQKQPLSLLAILVAVRERVPAARLLLVGRGPLEAEIRAEAARLGIAEAVTILDFRDDIERLFPALDVHLLVSRNEGFGLATAEAMSCGVPVVGTRVPGTEEVIEASGGGALVPLGDSLAAAEVVAGLLQAPPEERSAIGAAGRRSVLQRFSKQAWRERLGAFYERVLGTQA